MLSITSQSHPPKPSTLNPYNNQPLIITTRRSFVSVSTLIPFVLFQPSKLIAQPATSNNKTILSGLTSTKSWFRFYGDGFAIRVPPDFEDIMEPEDYNAGLSLYGDKAKPKTFAARFATPDGSEVVSVVLRPTNQLKITFLEAKDVSDFGTLKEARKIFVPGGTNLYSARAIKIKEDEGYRTYYFYEFGNDDQHAAVVAAVNRGKTIIAGVIAPESKWVDDGVKLRSAAVSLTVL
ncbi:mog1/PsbP/DUF1795-like photosystem II reaction center PsbP family protein [Artemisia annua]|uniref:Mog1/PsbP/DUF1795-like photosystem II reaction center PsbP family protein n=1 Tax=Artemisia annua TaxID=35608 RepID=A0A2U1NEA7_ARTAN|nr:mog1/PsbP/DUF1795-like photosystem II reaction center PsbP family protein [Artemisia annua]